MRACALVLLLWLRDLAQFEKLLVFCSLYEYVERLFATYVARLDAVIISIAANTFNDARSLDTLREASNDACGIFVMISLYFDIYHVRGL